MEIGVKSSGRGRSAKRSAVWKTRFPARIQRKVPRAVPLEAAAFGNLRGSFGSFRQFQLGPSTPCARCGPPPHAARLFLGLAILHAAAGSCPTPVPTPI